MAAVNFTSITDEAKKREKELRYLPWFFIMEELAKLGINIKKVKGIDVITELQRKSGILKPYNIGTAATEQTEVAKLSERELKLQTSYYALVDNIKNYATAPILNNPFDSGAINQSKKDPLEVEIIKASIKTFAEDVLDALFFAERDVTDLTPQGTFDGFNTLIADEKTATKISLALGNMQNTGAIIAPASSSSYAALTQLINFVRGADRMLRKYPADLFLTNAVYNHGIDSLENRMQYKDADTEALENYINTKCNSKIKIRTSDILGTGDNIMLTMPGLLDFGMDNQGDLDFVQIRSIKTDPNIVQFWMQADFGARINGLHKKVFCVNERAAVSDPISGDY